MPEVRPVQHHDVDALTQALTRAFADDPVTRWVYGGEPATSRWSERFFAWQLRRLLPQDVSWTTDDGAGGAALWALPDQWRESARETLGLVRVTFRGVLPRLPRILRGLGQVEVRHPSERHLYLAVLGVDPSRQGQGVGSQLIRAGLDLCDREHLPAYLETGKEQNLAFYGRHGFTVVDRLELPKGPPVWFLWREPGVRKLPNLAS